MKKINACIVALVLVALSAGAQDKPAATTNADPVIITAGDVKVKKSEFEAAVKTLPQEYQAFASGVGKKQFAEDFLKMKLLAQQGLKSGLDKDPEVMAQLSLMRENLVANAQLGRIEKDVKVTDEELKKIYEAEKNTHEQVKARHILIAFKGSPAAQPGKKELTEDEAKAKAEEIRKKLVAGANFDELAKAESDDVGSGARGGDLGEFNRGQMVPEFEKAAFEAKVGEVSPVIRTEYGYHIIKVDTHNFTPFEQVKPTLERRERQKKVQEAIEAVKSSAKPTFDPTYFAAPEPPKPAPAAAENKPATPSETKKP